MEARVARFRNLQPTADYIDSAIPGCERTTLRMLGQQPDAPLAADDFHMSMVRRVARLSQREQRAGVPDGDGERQRPGDEQLALAGAGRCTGSWRDSSVTMRALLLALALLSLPAGAKDIYRWVDENGKVHISDVVPEKYRKAAKRTSSSQFEVTPQERAAAEARAAADRERVRTSAAVAAEKANAAAAKPAAQATAPKPPAETACETAHRLYKESIDCFAPYINTRGATMGEAFKYCTELPDPSSRCGPPKPESSERR